MIPNLSEIKRLRIKLNLSQGELGKLCDISQSVLSKIENGFLDPPFSKAKRIFEILESQMEILEIKERSTRKAINIMTKNVISLNSGSKVKDAVNLMSKYEISQLPIIDDDKNLGSITARKIQKLITDNPEIKNVNIKLVRELPFPEIQQNWNIKDISDLLSKYPAILVKDFDEFIGIITNADFFKVL